MKKTLLLILALIACYTKAQTNPDGGDATTAKTSTTEIYTIVEQMAEFPGGQSAMAKFITDHVQYPDRAKIDHITGTAFLKFAIYADGSIHDVLVLRGVKDCPECDEEAARVIKLMPAWSPGKMNGKPVAVWYTLPFKFAMSK